MWPLTRIMGSDPSFDWKRRLSVLLIAFSFLLGHVAAEERLSITGVDYYTAPGAERVVGVNLELEGGRIRRIRRGESPGQ
jgi:hypothetical protein